MSGLLAVDGGGTKTHCVFIDESGEKLELLHYGSLNHERLSGGFAELQQCLATILNEIERRFACPATDIKTSVWGLAGIDTRSQNKKVSLMLAELGLRDFLLCNDAYLGIKAGTESGHGVCLVNGTGFNVLGVNAEGSRYQVGGLYNLTADFGGGFILGQTAISSSYRNLFYNKHISPLTRLVMDELGIQEADDFTDAVMERAARGDHHISSMAKLIFDAAQLGDAEASAMLQRMCHEYALATRVLFEHLPFPEACVEIVLIGSLFTKNWYPDVLPMLENELLEHCQGHQFKLMPLTEPPVIGAISWLLELANFSNEHKKRVIDTFWVEYAR